MTQLSLLPRLQILPCLLGCRMVLFQWDIKTLILLLISMAGSRMDTAERGFPPSWAPTAPTAELEILQEEERHLWEGMWVVRVWGVLKSCQRALPFHWGPILKSCGSSRSSSWRGKLSALDLKLCCTTPHRARPWRVPVALCVFTDFTDVPLQLQCNIRCSMKFICGWELQDKQLQLLHLLFSLFFLLALSFYWSCRLLLGCGRS